MTVSMLLRNTLESAKRFASPDSPSSSSLASDSKYLFCTLSLTVLVGSAVQRALSLELTCIIIGLYSKLINPHLLTAQQSELLHFSLKHQIYLHQISPILFDVLSNLISFSINVFRPTLGIVDRSGCALRDMIRNQCRRNVPFQHDSQCQYPQ